MTLNRQGRIEPESDGYFFHQTRFLSRFDIRSAGHALKPVCCLNVEPHATISYFLLPSPAGDKAGPPGDPHGGGEIVAKGIEPLCSRRQGSCRARSMSAPAGSATRPYRKRRRCQRPRLQDEIRIAGDALDFELCPERQAVAAEGGAGRQAIRLEITSRKWR